MSQRTASGRLGDDRFERHLRAALARHHQQPKLAFEVGAGVDEVSGGDEHRGDAPLLVGGSPPIDAAIFDFAA